MSRTACPHLQWHGGHRVSCISCVTSHKYHLITSHALSMVQNVKVVGCVCCNSEHNIVNFHSFLKSITIMRICLKAVNLADQYVHTDRSNNYRCMWNYIYQTNGRLRDLRHMCQTNYLDYHDVVLPVLR